MCFRTMKKEDLTQNPVCDDDPAHPKAAAHLTHVHSMLDSSQNQSSSLQELFNRRNCSLFTIPLPSVGKEMPLSFSESAGMNSSAAAPWKDSFHLHFSSSKDSPDLVSRCIDGISVRGWLEKACSLSGDFSSCCPGDTFVCFAQFWLGHLQCNKTLRFLGLERSSSKENEGQFAFLKALKLGGLSDPCCIPAASLNDLYAVGLLNQNPWFFLCYLNLVFSEQTPGYEQMLLNIQYVANNFPIIQLVISVLAFALAGLWCAVVRLSAISFFTFGVFPSMLSPGKAFQSKEEGHDFVSHENSAVPIIRVPLSTSSTPAELSAPQHPSGRNTRTRP